MNILRLPAQPLVRLGQSDLFFKVIRGAGVTFVIQVLALGIGYVSQILLARWMGPAEYGVYAYATAWALLLAVVPGLGLHEAILRFIPQYIAQSDWARLRGVIRWSWQVVVLASLALAVIATPVILWLHVYSEMRYELALILGVWTVPLIVIANLQIGMSRAIQQAAVALAPTLLVRPVLILAGAFLILLIGHQLSSVMVLGLGILTLALVWPFQLKLFQNGIPAEARVSRPVYETRAWLQVSLPLFLTALFAIAASQTSVLMSGTFLGPTEAGILNAAIKTTSIISFILLAINVMAGPVFAALDVHGDRAALQELLFNIAVWSFWPAAVMTALLIVFSKFMLGLFGSEFVKAQPEVAILALGQLVNVATGPVGMLLNMTGHQTTTLRVVGWSALANVLLTAIGIYFFGITGAALASALTLAGSNIWLCMLVAKKLGVYPSIVSALLARRRKEGRV